ncbi:MAG: PTS sugar transporter subunit IIA [Spirochaetales bacterium]|nr:PTS sugar transporter subunit IIA [Spirochaetales bacterium]
MTNNGQTGNEQIYTLTEIAQFFKVAEKTIIRMIQRGEIPAIKIGSQWRFIKEEIDQWLHQQGSSNKKDPLVQLLENSPEELPVSRLIKPEHIILNLKAGSKEDILIQLTESLVKEGLVEDRDWFVEKLLAREEMASTAINMGVAVPHFRHPQENRILAPLVVLGICPEGTDFQSRDGEKSTVFFLICTSSEIAHLRILSKIATFIQSKENLQPLIECKTKEEVISFFLS